MSDGTRRGIAPWHRYRPALIWCYDVLALTATWPLALLLRYDFDVDAIEFHPRDVLVVAFAAAAVLGTTGVHRAFWRHATVADLVQVTAGVAAAVAVAAGVLFVVDRAPRLPRSVPILHLMLAAAALVGARIAWMMLVRRRSTPAGRFTPAADFRPVLLVGGGDGAALAIQVLRHRAPFWRPVGILDEETTIGRQIDGIPVLGSIARSAVVLARLYVQGLYPEKVIVADSGRRFDDATLRPLLEAARFGTVEILRLSEIVRLEGFETNSSELSAPPEVSVLPRRKLVYLGAKRFVDTTVAVMGLLAGLVVLLPAALAVRLVLGPPAFFVQIRRGRGLVPFYLVKLKTMVDPVDADGRERGDDQRHHPLGRFLRRFKIDELPQLWNVLRGEMALVGPRPLVDRDLLELPDQGRARATMRPGLTGWAQVNGGQLLGPVEKHALDLWYIDHASLSLDLRILWLTLVMVLRGERVNEAEVARALRALSRSGTLREAADLRAEVGATA